MRRSLVAGFAALAVLLGLTLSAGTAFAQGSNDDVTPKDPATTSTAGAIEGSVDVNLSAKVKAEATARTRTAFAPCVPVKPGWHLEGAVCVPNRHDGDHGNGFPRGGSHGYPGSWNDRLDGRYFRLDQGPALDVCDSGASNYDLWLNRNGSYRDRIIRQLNAQRWNDLRRSDCGAVSVSNDGQCVTYRQDALRYGNDLNTTRRDWSGLRLRLLSSHRGWNGSDLSLLSLSERNDWNRFSSLDRQRFDNYNRVYSQLRTVCSDPNPPVVIVQAPAAVTYAAPAPADNSAAAAPQAVAPTTGSIPSGSVNTGGNSVAFTLAHARAI